jgi:hypothetical protein
MTRISAGFIDSGRIEVSSFSSSDSMSDASLSSEETLGESPGVRDLLRRAAAVVMELGSIK